MKVPGSLSSALQTMYFGFGDFLSTNCHLRPVGKPAPPRPAKTGLLDVLDHRLRGHRQRLLQALVAVLVLDVVIELGAAGRERVFRQHRLVIGQRFCLRRRRRLRALGNAALAEVAAVERLDAVGLHAIDEAAHLFRFEVLVPVIVVDHHHRRAVARAEAFHLLDGEHAGWIGFADLDAQLALQLLDDAFGAGKGARQRGADLQHVLADRAAVEHDVVRDHVFDFRRGARR